MRSHLFAALLLPPLLVAGPALAQSVPVGGAEDLNNAAAAYFGKSAIDQGILVIAPQGEGYLATLDLQRVFEELKLPSGALRIERWSFLLVPQADGAWKTTADAFPAIDFDVPANKGAVSGSLRVNGFRFGGVYQPKLAAFENSTTAVDSIDLKLHMPDPASGMPADFNIHQAAGTSDITAADAGGGAVTIKLAQKNEAMHETITVAPPAEQGAPAAPPIQTIADVGPITAEGGIEAFRAPSLNDLWVFLVAHQADPVGAAAIAELQSQLKTKLLATLPIWDSFNATLTLHDMTTESAGVALAIKTFSETVTMSGLQAHASLGLAVKCDDVSFHAPGLPPWVEPLLPTSLAIDVKVTMDGLDRIARTVIDDLDVDKQPPLPAATEAKIAALAKSGNPRLVFAPSRWTSASLDLGFQGELTLTPPKPTGRFKISASGLDKALVAVKQAAESDPRLQQAVLGVTFMRGLATTDADGRLVWDIALDADGGVAINGVAMPKDKK